MSKYSKEDAARDTGVSTKEVSKTWHEARNDASRNGFLSERNANKVRDSESGSTLYNIFKKVGLAK
ncbi:hypothetical protein KJ934_02280 [Patescibacteria group bacterium]|nr:hypothetical protein [Patescibacteria group bacterium]MBU4353596.1 hypothetical protein [Patescibacteria group bacterium]MBU4476895.1 hypothetical protein [Patescibacteria group bacterium]MCG2699084.1 hypothetical protein [Candidatus Parcubacteria bacterium]